MARALSGCIVFLQVVDNARTTPDSKLHKFLLRVLAFFCDLGGRHPRLKPTLIDPNATLKKRSQLPGYPC
jgi:hypothetical protein